MRVLAVALRRRLDQVRPDPDRGTTLVELMVGMALMSIFMGIVTAAVVGMFSSSTKTQAVENSSAQLDTAFDRLDKQVRYATAIDQPVAPTTANAYWSVAFETIDPTPTTTPAPPTCTQLRVYTGTATLQRLVERTWTLNPDGSVLTSSVSGWSQLAAGGAAGLGDQPFTTWPIVSPMPAQVVAGATVQQLQLSFIATDGSGQSSSKTTFSALNSSAALKSASSGTYVAACSQEDGTL